MDRIMPGVAPALANESIILLTVRKSDVRPELPENELPELPETDLGDEIEAPARLAKTCAANAGNSLFAPVRRFFGALLRRLGASALEGYVPPGRDGESHR